MLIGRVGRDFFLGCGLWNIFLFGIEFLNNLSLWIVVKSLLCDVGFDILRWFGNVIRYLRNEN